MIFGREKNNTDLCRINHKQRMKKKKKINERVLRILRALNELGGCGTLEQIYEVTDTSDWGTNTPEATIRQKLQLGRGKFFVQLRKGVWCTVPYYQQYHDIHILSDRVTAIEKKPQVVQIVTDSISVNSPTPHYVADETKTVVKEEDVVTPPAKQQEVVAEQPVKQEKMKEEEIDYTTHAFAIHVTNPDKIQEVMVMLHRKMKKGGSLKQWMLPYRAAIEAGVISRTIKWKDFVDEFGEISSTTYSNYANRNGFYTAEQLDDLVELFMRVGGFDH